MTHLRFNTVLSLAMCGALLAGCGGLSSQRVDPGADDDLGGTLIDSADVIATTDQAAADLAAFLLRSSRSDLKVAVSPIKNESVQPINTSLLTDRMRNQLVRETSPRVKYLAREHIDAVVDERDGKRDGVFSGSDRRQLLGADYLLTGRINSLSKRADGDRADYFQLGFVLVDAEDGSIVWSDQYEFKKTGDAGAIYQ